MPRQFQIGSTAHDRHRPVTTHQCCWQLLLLVDRRRACSANDHSRAPAPSAAMSTATRLSLHQAPPPLYPAADPICQSRRLPRSRLPGAFKSIVSARRTVLPMPARGFLPRGLSDACPRSLPHCQVTGRHLITLNDCGFWGRPAVPCQTLRKNTATSGSSARVREALYPTNLSAAFATAALDPISGP